MHVLGFAEARGGLADRREHLLQVGRGRCDDAQDVGGGRLLLQCLGQLGVALLQFLEQPRVLDGDDGLVREGLQQCDLLSVNGRTLPTEHPSVPIGRPSRIRGVISLRPDAVPEHPTLGETARAAPRASRVC